MSETVQQDPRQAQRPTRGAAMEWARWCDGQQHTLHRSVDEYHPCPCGRKHQGFVGSALTKRSSFRQWAKRQMFVDATGEVVRGSDGEPIVGFRNTRETVINTADQEYNSWFTIEVRPEAWPAGAVGVLDQLHQPRTREPKAKQDPLEARRERLAGEDPELVVRKRRMRRS